MMTLKVTNHIANHSEWNDWTFLYETDQHLKNIKSKSKKSVLSLKENGAYIE